MSPRRQFQDPRQEVEEAVVKPLAMCYMARTALHGKDTQRCISRSPPTSNAVSSGILQFRTTSRYVISTLEHDKVAPILCDHDHTTGFDLTETLVLMQNRYPLA
jgi:hypothetical protein